MRYENMIYTTTSSVNVPISLLLEADPEERSIRSYLSDSLAFVAQNYGEIIAACLVVKRDTFNAEIVNISVQNKHHRKGIGSELLSFCLEQLSEQNVKKVELGTGTFGYQLAFYQRFGFRVDGVIKDYFVKNYAYPIYENGIQHKDMLTLSLNLSRISRNQLL